MKFSYQFTTIKEKFSLQVYNMLVENFLHTYFVGGFVRDILLHKKTDDIDLTTNAIPDEVIALLQKNRIAFDAQHKRYGVITADPKRHKIEITTLRKETTTSSRYPAVSFVQSPRIDSRRCDFTVNSLYFSPKNKEILDFTNGLKDLRNKTLRFIGLPRRRITEDPLRIVRAYRFRLQLQFSFDEQTARALDMHAPLLRKISATRITTEINKLQTKSMREKLRTIINKST